MGLAGTQLIANLHDEYGFMLLDDGIFSFLGSQIGVFILQLLRGDKGYLAAQLGCDAGVFFLYDFECITDCKNDTLHSEFQLFDISLFGSDNSFPIPLVYIDRVQVIQGFISADGVHIGIQTLAGAEIITIQCHAFPLCQRMNNLCGCACCGNFKAYGAFYAAEIIVQTCMGVNEQRGGNTFQIQCLSQMFFKSVVNHADGILCFI